MGPASVGAGWVEREAPVEWSAQVEWRAPEPYTAEDLAELARVLGEYHVSISPIRGAREGPEVWVALLQVEARSLRRGAARAIAIVEAATGQGAVGLTVELAGVRCHQVAE